MSKRIDDLVAEAQAMCWDATGRPTLRMFNGFVHILDNIDTFDEFHEAFCKFVDGVSHYRDLSDVQKFHEAEMMYETYLAGIRRVGIHDPTNFTC